MYKLSIFVPFHVYSFVDGGKDSAFILATIRQIAAQLAMPSSIKQRNPDHPHESQWIAFLRIVRVFHPWSTSTARERG